MKAFLKTLLWTATKALLELLLWIAVIGTIVVIAAALILPSYLGLAPL